MKPFVNEVKIITAILLLTLYMGSCAPFPDLPEDFSQRTPNESSETTEGNTLDEGSSGVASGSSTGEGEGVATNSSELTETVPRIEPTGLVLNEIYYDAPGSDTDGVLFVELYAATAGSLSGYTIRFVNGGNGKVTETIELPENMEVNDEDFYVIADGRTGALETTQVGDYDFIDNFDPQNGPDGVQLLDWEGGLVDSVVYGEGALSVSDDGLPLGEGVPALDPDSGFSISRITAGLDTDDNASDFIINEDPSPGTGELLLPGLDP